MTRNVFSVTVHLTAMVICVKMGFRGRTVTCSNRGKQVA